MKKVLLSTILYLISVAIFAQTEPTKYLIKYLETNTSQPDHGVTYLSDNQFIYKSPNTEKINPNSLKLSESNLFIATFDESGDISDKKQIQGLETNKVTKTGATYSPDLKTVYFSSRKYRKSLRRKDKEQLFKADVDANGNWTNIEKLPFSTDRYSFGEPSLSKNGRDLYFTSDMSGSSGGADIFMVVINDDGTFGDPKNLGGKVNTSGNEVTPYITKDSKLYFSSDNHKDGLGNLDVYYIDLNNPNAEPIHLDAPINSPNDDFAFIINNKDDRGYFSSNRLQGQNNHDIYSFLVEKVKEDGPCLQAISGVVKDDKTKEIIKDAIITLFDEDDNELEQIKTDAEGKYSLTLDCNKTYTLKAGGINYNTEDHIVNTANYLEAPTLEANKLLVKKTAEEIEAENTIIAEADDAKEAEEALRETEVEKVETDDNELVKDAAKTTDSTNTIDEDEAAISAVYFGFDKATINSKAARELDKLTKILKNNKTVHVELSSYTDSRGGSAYNLRLSERRAQASADYLVAQGIDRNRIKAKGYGESKMVNKCIDGIECSEVAHEKNRRTEFAFINPQVSSENFEEEVPIEENEELVIEVEEATEVKSSSVTNNVEEALINKEEPSSYSLTEEGESKELASNISKVSEAKETETPSQNENLTEDNNEQRIPTDKKAVTSVASSSKKNDLSNVEDASASFTDSKNITTKSENKKNTIQESNNDTNNTSNKEEENLSNEAKWLNKEIEKGNAEYENSEAKKEAENKANSEPKKQLIEPVSINSQNEELNDLTLAAETEEKKESKFNFEKEKETSGKPNNNTDPNQLLSELKARREAEKANNPELVSNTNIDEEKKESKLPLIKKEAILNTSEVSVRAMHSKRGKYVETEKSKKINALRVSFRVQPNNRADKGYKDAYVVIKSPSGKIVNEKGLFPLADGKDLAYTDQTTIYYNGQSIKAVMFIDKIVHKFTKGVYTVNIFIDGIDVGENIITLS